MVVFVLFIEYILTKHLFFSFTGLLKTKYSNGSNLAPLLNLVLFYFQLYTLYNL